jgi:hypothetical protein
MLPILLSLVTSLASAAESAPAANCARVSLSAIYGAEKSYHSEYEKFSESYQDIGFEPDQKECPDWEGYVRVFNGGQEFLATYTKPSTGETWTINEKKELRQD